MNSMRIIKFLTQQFTMQPISPVSIVKKSVLSLSSSPFFIGQKNFRMEHTFCYTIRSVRYQNKNMKIFLRQLSLSKILARTLVIGLFIIFIYICKSFSKTHVISSVGHISGPQGLSDRNKNCFKILGPINYLIGSKNFFLHFMEDILDVQ